MVYGTGMGSREDLRKLDDSPALDPYNGDGRAGWGWSVRGTDGGNVRAFGIAFLPHDATTTDEVHKRLQFRVEEYQHATGR